MNLQVATCESSSLDESAILVAVALQGDAPSGEQVASMQPLGLVARPRDPDVGPDGRSTGGANALYSFDGGEGFVMPLLDPRFVAKVPPLKKGGTALYSAPGAILNFDGDDGTTLLLCPATNGKSHVVVLDNPNDAVQVRHARGHGLSMLGTGKKPVVLNNAAGNACVMLDDDGLVLSANTKCMGSMIVGVLASAQDVALAPAYEALLTLVVSLVGKLAAAPAVLGVVTPAELTELGALLATVTTTGRSQVLKASPGPT